MPNKNLLQPILILNLQFNDSDPKPLEIYSMGDATTQIQSFCTANGIKDKNIVERLRNRIAACLINFESADENKQDENLPDKAEQKPWAENKPNGHKRLKSKQLFIDTSAKSLGMQSLAYTSKTTKAMGHNYSTVQGQGHKLVKSLAEAVKARLFTTKASKLNEQQNKEHTEDKNNIIEKKDVKMVPQTSISITEGVQKAFNQSNLSTMTSNRSVFNFNEFKAVPRNTPAKSFINSLTDEKTKAKNNTSHSITRNPKIFKKSSFYEYSQLTDHRLDQNIYQHFGNPRQLEKMDTDSIESLDDNVLKRISIPELKLIFNKLDCEGFGHIGPRKMDLRSLSAVEMQNTEPIIAEILKRDKDAYFNFKDFCKIANQFVIID